MSFPIMEMESILGFLENKSILVTGATGYLAKIFVEKILRVQPNVKKLYLLLRASDCNSAMQRLRNEVVHKELFRALREKWGAEFDFFVSEKVVPIPGDITCENLGVKDLTLQGNMCNGIDIIINCAAITNFDERYDVALGVNTFGVLNLLSFAKKCIKLKMLLHVSTAYVCGDQAGVILENPFYMNETKRTITTRLDFKVEKKLVEEKLQELKAQETSEEAITTTMKDFGMKRANLYGWPNTYVFTKAIGEMILGSSKDSMPLVIIRPTMVTSTYKEPFPGWIEGLRTIDSVVAAIGKGKVTCFLGNPTTIVDVIPADMVVNSMIAATVAHANQRSGLIIYHVGSSLRNPVDLCDVNNFISHYFIKNPLIAMNGKPVKVKEVTLLLSSMAIFRLYMVMRFMIPLKGLQLVNKAFGHYYEDSYTNNFRKFKLVMRLVELYKPYALFKGIFDDTNTEKLRIATRERFVDAGLFNFDPRFIDWEDYIMNTHIPGLKKYVIKS